MRRLARTMLRIHDVFAILRLPYNWVFVAKAMFRSKISNSHYHVKWACILGAEAGAPFMSSAHVIRMSSACASQPLPACSAHVRHTRSPHAPALFRTQSSTTTEPCLAFCAPRGAGNAGPFHGFRGGKSNLERPDRHQTVGQCFCNFARGKKTNQKTNNI